MASTEKKATKKKVAATLNPANAATLSRRLGGMPAEKALFDQLRDLAVSLNKLNEGIQKVYNVKTPVVKTEINIPKCAYRGDDELGGIAAEKSLFAQLKTISSSLDKTKGYMQKGIQKVVKAKAEAKRAVAKKPAAKKTK
jgi:hypothetical protein